MLSKKKHKENKQPKTVVCAKCDATVLVADTTHYEEYNVVNGEYVKRSYDVCWLCQWPEHKPLPLLLV